jgi:hypothetical protein
MKLTYYPGFGEEKVTNDTYDSNFIPDLWHIGQQLKASGQIEAYQAVMETWHIAHALNDTLSQ